MLAAIGLPRIEDLFATIPEEVRFEGRWALPEPLSEGSLIAHLGELSQKNADASCYINLLGGGAYHHYIPKVLDHLLLRSEFYTSYTPYQPEISQGTLQSMFEFQSMICELTGMEVANASMYDGASSLAEALLVASRITKRYMVIISRTIHPEYRQVVRTYLHNSLERVIEIPFDEKGTTDINRLRDHLGPQVAAVALQSPNFFGCIEEMGEVARMAHQTGSLLIVAITEPLSLGLLKPPGEMGADIVVGEGQSFGIPLSFGGPYLGLFATRREYVRAMPGRIVGETTDGRGQRGFVLTLSTREQHIRREEATSNICTNEGLCALAATIFLALMGREGIRELALLNLSKAQYAKELLKDRVRFPSPTFNEFVIQPGRDVKALLRELLEEKILGGVDLTPFYPELKDCLLLCFTEMVPRAAIDNLAKVVRG